MMILITYDVNTEKSEGKRRLRQVAKICENYGQRVQKSVFECLVDPVQLVVLTAALKRIIYEKEDSLRVYHLGSKWERKIDHLGIESAYRQEGPIIL